jgi:hypothetical protein
MKRNIVIESPYAGDVERNLSYLRLCLRDSLMRGESPIASHGLLTQPGVLDDTIPAERELGIGAGHAWHPVADSVVFYGDLGWSEGMWQAWDRCVDLGLGVEVRSLPIGWTLHLPAPTVAPDPRPFHATIFCIGLSLGAVIGIFVGTLI